MTIQTKFNKGDELFFIHNDDVYARKVIDVKYEEGIVFYRFDVYPEPGLSVNIRFANKPERVCFPKKNDLLDYYVDRVN